MTGCVDAGWGLDDAVAVEYAPETAAGQGGEVKQVQLEVSPGTAAAGPIPGPIALTPAICSSKLILVENLSSTLALEAV
jgi:hypothetical protein